MSILVLIDGNAILHRAYHALPPLIAKDGKPINAVYGLISMLLGLIQTLRPTHIAFCFDRKEPTFRKKAFVSYQAQRPAMDDDLSSQFEKARKVIRAMNIPVYSKAGFEADDVTGTLAFQSTNNLKHITNNKSSVISHKLIDEVVIVTGDRDILQLVDERIKVYLPIKGVSEGKVYDKNDVFLKMGCTPPQIVDYKALVGDPSDNYPGVPGIGPKTATALLAKYGSFENIYKQLSEISPSTRKKLEDGRKSGEMSYHLAKIVTNVDVDVDLSTAEKWKVDGDEVLKTFSEFGFKTLTGRVKKVGKELETEKQLTLI